VVVVAVGRAREARETWRVVEALQQQDRSGRCAGDRKVLLASKLSDENLIAAPQFEAPKWRVV